MARLVGLAKFNTSAVAPVLLSPCFAGVANTVAGDCNLSLQPNRGLDAAQSAWIVSPAQALAASGLLGASLSHTSDTVKRLMSVQEQAAGAASILADAVYSVLAIDLLGTNKAADELDVVGVGVLQILAGTPSWLWQSGCFTDVFTDNGVGDITINLGASYGIDAAEGAVVAHFQGVRAASQNTGCGVVDVSDTAKRVTMLQEGAAGAASALTDLGRVSVVAIANRKRKRAGGPRLLGAGQISAVPAITSQSGMLASVAAGAGPSCVHTLMADRGWDATRAVMLCSPVGLVLAGSDLPSVHESWGSDTQETTYGLQEAGGGAASALTALAYDWAVFGTP